MVPFDKVVVANRGEVAARVIRALDGLGVASVAVFSDADADAPHLEMADEVHHIGESSPRASYLDQDAILGVVRSSGADGLHPGYGFLAEHAGFARRVIETGARWIGPSPEWLEIMGHKTTARRFVAQRGLPVGTGSEVISTDQRAIEASAAEIGFPIMVKPAGGGGGIGMFAASTIEELIPAVERASSLASRGFSNADVYLERLLHRPRHVEIQVLGDRHGDVRHLFERDCSIQRRHQKIIEEAPAPGILRSAVEELAARIVEVLADAGYDNIGTVETLLAESGEYQFLEMNTRLQVEHCVTEEVTGVDLVATQIRLAAGEPLSSILPQPPSLDGHAIEARVYAEDPVRFLPSPGRLDVFRPPQDVRVETGYREGQAVTPFYDPLLAKVVVHAPTRNEAIYRLAAALMEFEIAGVKHNIPALTALLESQEFREGRVHTGLAETVVSHKGVRGGRVEQA
ncbi:MAG: biotin carboxylase [Acidimicrobiia bacterium]|nr:biotin carboxylase [Acidimicrobiia bacterium]